jgi:polyhydroxybutyrate depolymerase
MKTLPKARMTQAVRLLLGVSSLLLAAGCTDGSDPRAIVDIIVEEPIEEVMDEKPTLMGCADTSDCASNPPLEIGGERLANVLIPSNYDVTTRYPLIVVLHGFGANGAIQSAYLGLTSRVDDRQYVVVTPDGTENMSGTRFWNATTACCAGAAAAQDGPDVDYTDIDDVAYIRSLIEEAAQTYSIDPTSVGLIGHSNGGFMALRMACEVSELVTAVVSIAGSTFEDASSCAPATYPVSILTIHGTEDATIPYEGATFFEETYPGALETIDRFATLAGCGSSSELDNIDVDESIDGAETAVLSYTDCTPDTDVTLWTIVGGPHIPVPWVESAQDSFVDWLLDHTRL